MRGLRWDDSVIFGYAGWWLWWWNGHLIANTVSCSEDLSGMTRGVISSPSWPASYAENANCQYTLSVEAHLQLELHFSDDFDVEQSPDGQCIDALTVGAESEYMKKYFFCTKVFSSKTYNFTHEETKRKFRWKCWNWGFDSAHPVLAILSQYMTHFGAFFSESTPGFSCILSKTLKKTVVSGADLQKNGSVCSQS